MKRLSIFKFIDSINAIVLNRDVIYKVLLLVGLFFSILQFSHHSFIYNYADDWCWSSYFSESVATFLKGMSSLYQNHSGRLVVTGLTEFLAFQNINVWRGINPIFFMFFAVIMLNLVLISFEKISLLKLIIGVLSLLVFLFSFDITVARETVYWLTGSINYLWPLVMSLLLINYFYHQLFIIKLPKWGIKQIFWVLLAFVAGGLTEQVGLVTTIVFTLFILWKIYTKSKIFPVWCLVYAAHLVGYVLLLVSPGNYVRLSLDNLWISPDLNFYQRILDRAPQIYSNVFASPNFIQVSFYMTLLLLLWFWNLKTKSKFIPIILFCLSFYFLMFVFQSRMEFWFTFSNLLDNPLTLSFVAPYILWTVFMIVMLFGFLKVTIEAKNPLLFACIVSGYAAQFAMLLVPFSGHRSVFISLPFFWIAIIYLVIDLTISKLFRISYLIFLPFFIVPAITNYIHIWNGYQQNKVVHEANIIKINMKTSPLVLKQMSNDLYGFDMPYTNSEEWVKTCFNTYYDISNETKVLWIK